MSKYNKYTKMPVLARYVGQVDSGEEWAVSPVNTITFVEGGWLRVLPRDTEFKYIAPDGDTREEVEDYIENRGILDACNISDGDFERMLEDDDDEVEIEGVE